MGIPLTVYTLHRLDGDACSHHLLLRVRQPGFSNADAGAYDRAVQVAEGRRDALIRAYESGLPCPAPHTVHLVGGLQSWPVGDELVDGPAGREVDVWVAQTRYGHPWVVLGTAESEDAFWRAVEDDDDLAGLGPVRPAVRRRALFLADEEGDDDDAGPTGELI